MDDESNIFLRIRCPKCERRLNKPHELKCKHLVCRDCLEIILQNHRTNARCPTCTKPLENYAIETYSELSPKHPTSRLISTFNDVNQCETCKTFTTVEKCSKCLKDQCDTCLDKHIETHNQIKKQVNTSPDGLSKDEKELLESLKNILTEKEYEDFVQTAKLYLNDAIVKGNGTNKSSRSNESPVNIEKTPFLVEAKPYDWSEHERFTADDILNSKPERVKQLLRLNFTPRPYQIRMVRCGLKKENSLVCLQTGAGKTFVAGIVAKFFYILSRQKLNNSPNISRQFKAVFLVPIKALVDQQCEAFRKVFIDEPDSILLKVENQAGERFKDLFNNFNIFFITVQKFANFIEAKHADLKKFDLIMIDECHHCYDNHPINSMMRQYHRLKASGCDVPQVIALTASVGTNKKNAFNHLVHLCANLDCFDICAIGRGLEEEELKNSTNTPMADHIVTVSKEEYDPIVITLKDNVMKTIANRLALDISAMDNQKLENELVQRHKDACKTNDHDAVVGTDYLRKFNRFLIFYDDLPLKQCMQWLEDKLGCSTPSLPTRFEKFCQEKLKEFRDCAKQQMLSSIMDKPKLRKLIDLITKLHDPGCRGLILVRTKFHTVALEEFLNNHPDIMKRQIAVGHLTGQGSADELCLPGTQQAVLLNEFRKGTKTLLVATDVAQEGLDVAECSYVIRYEFVSNEIGTVQSRGRARASQSRCFILTEAQSINYQRELENRERENEMKEAIDEWRRRGIDEFRTLVNKEQEDLIKELCKSDSQSGATNSSQNYQKPAKEIHCRFCDTYLCKGSSLRLQGSTIVCVDSEFERLVNPRNSAGEKFNCPNKTCHKELGVVVLLSRNSPAYALHITALKFFMNDKNEPVLFKKWSQYHGFMKPAV
ncbi:unnamed protein product [Adineta steineri]|uniref:RNA helicase n=1 Tax=Adineta steineri TaxID=433720 RepID=A0A813XUD9_9BILA|nr:unnamed protein product [Adineta steineri]